MEGVFVRRPSIKLVNIWGIRIGVDPSWFLVLFLVIFSLSGSFRAVLDSSDGVAYLTAVATALLFFVSLLAHELGHALVARRLGVEVQGIDLFLLGGLTRRSRDAETPGEEFKIAAAGPAVTLAIVVVCLAAGLLAGGADRLFGAARLDDTQVTTPAFLLLSWLTTMNVLLLVFNLLPAYPLDGGRIARALVWRLKRDRTAATRFSATVGRGFGYVLAGVGVYFLAVAGSLYGLWALVLAYFFVQASRGAVAQTAFSERLDGVRVADIMDSEPVSVGAELPAGRAQEEFFLRYRWDWFPVVDERGHFAGVVREDRVQGAVGAGETTVPVRLLMEADEAHDWRVGADAPIESLLASESLRRRGALMAVDAEGVLRGVITLDQVRRALVAAATPPVR